ncbi:hypothetical protein H4Q26_002453 [Puccinia striiformis f. sp. tritici PST-130]|nr:hypothetical protein H4Q26_002453 [Puccinia striiformis f. sp. tritici PST-130]
MNNRSSMPPPSGQPVRAPPTAASQPKRKRRTKAEMVAYRADGDAREKHRVAALKLAQNQRTAKRTAKQTASASQSQRVPPTNSRSQPAPAGSRLANSRDVSDGSPLFQHDDYGLVCTYLKNPKNFTEIHGNGSRTTVGPKCITKGAAYERFAIYMNDSSRSGLTLNGKLLRQRIVAYKKKFFDAKKASNSTGEGTLEGDQFESYDQKLEDECPYYSRMNTIFGNRSNYTPADLFESETGACLYSQATSLVPLHPTIDPSLGGALSSLESPERSFASRELTSDLPSDNNQVDDPNIHKNDLNGKHPSLEDIHSTSSQQQLLDSPGSPTISVVPSTLTQGSSSPTTAIQPRKRTMASLLGTLRQNIAREDAQDLDDSDNPGAELESTPVPGSSASRGRYVNLPGVDRSIPAPRRETASQKGKLTVAGAFESSSELISSLGLDSSVINLRSRLYLSNPVSQSHFFKRLIKQSRFQAINQTKKSFMMLLSRCWKRSRSRLTGGSERSRSRLTGGSDLDLVSSVEAISISSHWWKRAISISSHWWKRVISISSHWWKRSRSRLTGGSERSRSRLTGGSDLDLVSSVEAISISSHWWKQSRLTYFQAINRNKKIAHTLVLLVEAMLSQSLLRAIDLCSRLNYFQAINQNKQLVHALVSLMENKSKKKVNALVSLMETILSLSFFFKQLISALVHVINLQISTLIHSTRSLLIIWLTV